MKFIYQANDFEKTNPSIRRNPVAWSKLYKDGATEILRWAKLGGLFCKGLLMLYDFEPLK